jgi:hypothetical protein
MIRVYLFTVRSKYYEFSFTCIDCHFVCTVPKGNFLELSVDIFVSSLSIFPLANPVVSSANSSENKEETLQKSTYAKRKPPSRPPLILITDYLKIGVPIVITNGALIPPAPLVMAHRTRKRNTRNLI